MATAELQGILTRNITDDGDNKKDEQITLSGVEVITPVNDDDIATKAYVDTLISAASEASGITVDTTEFSGNLDNTVTDVQKLATAVDTLTTGGGSTKTLLGYVNDFDLTNPPAYGMFLIIGNFDPYTMQSNYNYILNAKLGTAGQLTYKRYNAANEVIETKTVYSGENILIDTNNANATVTTFGKLTKVSIEPADTGNPITTHDTSSKYNLIAIATGTNYYDSFTSMSSAFYGNQGLVKALLSDTMNTITTFANAFSYCYMLQSLTMPTSMSACTVFSSSFYTCKELESVTLPATVGNVTTLAAAFQNCWKLTTVSLPAAMNSLTALNSLFINCYSLTTITLPTSSTAITTLQFSFYGCEALATIPEFASIGTNQIDMEYVYNGHKATVFDQSAARVSKLSIGGGTAYTPTQISSIEVDWANSEYGGSAPQVDLRYNNLDKTELDRIFTALPTATKTINVVGNPGAATCDATIATAKNWTVVTA